MGMLFGSVHPFPQGVARTGSPLLLIQFLPPLKDFRGHVVLFET